MDTPYFPFYPGDWLSDPNVQQLTLEESGAYITLLAYIWRNGHDCRIPDDNQFIARVLHISGRKWSSLRKVLVDGPMPVFHCTDDGKLLNKRLDAEYQKAVGKIQKRTDAANKRWNGGEQTACKSNASASVVHVQNDAIRDPDPDTDTEKDKDAVAARVGDMAIQGLETEVEQRLQQRMGNPGYKILGKDYEALQKLLAEEIPLVTILAGIDEAFEHHQPRHSQDKIRTLRYCLGAILDRWTGQSVAAGAHRPRAPAKAAGSEKDPRYTAFYDLFPE